MALARKIVSADEEDETETVESVFAQARDAEAAAGKLLVDDGWKPEKVNGHDLESFNRRRFIGLVIGHHQNYVYRAAIGSCPQSLYSSSRFTVFKSIYAYEQFRRIATSHEDVSELLIIKPPSL